MKCEVGLLTNRTLVKEVVNVVNDPRLSKDTRNSADVMMIIVVNQTITKKMIRARQNHAKMPKISVEVKYTAFIFTSLLRCINFSFW